MIIKGKLPVIAGSTARYVQYEDQVFVCEDEIHKSSPWAAPGIVKMASR